MLIARGSSDSMQVKGTWRELTDNVNAMAANLTDQVRNIAAVTTAVAEGDLTKKVSAHCKGEILQLKETINKMVDRLQNFASEVTKVAREVGTEGKLGGQARVEDVEGTWKSLTENVNGMARNLTTQVRSIASVTTAVAEGNLSRTIDVHAQGEILLLKDTINKMVERLQNFATEVTKVAKEVGTDGILGGQARVCFFFLFFSPATCALAHTDESPRCKTSKELGRTSRTMSTSWPTISQRKCEVLRMSPLQSRRVI